MVTRRGTSAPQSSFPLLPVVLGAGLVGGIAFVMQRNRMGAPVPGPVTTPPANAPAPGGFPPAGGLPTPDGPQMPDATPQPQMPAPDPIVSPGVNAREGDHVVVPELALTSRVYGRGLEPQTKAIWGIDRDDDVVILVSSDSTPELINGVVIGVIRGKGTSNQRRINFGRLDPIWGAQGRSFVFERNLVTSVSRPTPPLPKVGDLVEVESRNVYENYPRVDRPVSYGAGRGLRQFGVPEPWMHVLIQATGVDDWNVGGHIVAGSTLPLAGATFLAPRSQIISISPAPPAGVQPGALTPEPAQGPTPFNLPGRFNR